MLLKQAKIILISTLLISSISYAFGAELPVQVKQKCSDAVGNSIDYPIKNGEVYVVTPSGPEFMATDDNGVFLIDEQFINKPIQIYLANKRKTVFVGCYSNFTVKTTNVVVLGAPGSICPKSNCHFISQE